MRFLALLGMTKVNYLFCHSECNEESHPYFYIYYNVLITCKGLTTRDLPLGEGVALATDEGNH